MNNQQTYEIQTPSNIFIITRDGDIDKAYYTKQKRLKALRTVLNLAGKLFLAILTGLEMWVYSIDGNGSKKVVGGQ